MRPAASTVQWLLSALLLVLPVSAQAMWTKQQIIAMVAQEAQTQKFPPHLALAVAQVESNFDPFARSHKDARGVMQILPQTAEQDLGISAASLYNPRVNIRAGIKFLRRLLHVYDGRVDIALSHYNGGSRVRTPDGSLQVIPATQSYVLKVLDQAQRFKASPSLHLASVTQNQRRQSRIAVLDDFAYGDPLSRHKAGLAVSVEAGLDGQGLETSSREQMVASLERLANYNQNRVLMPRRDDQSADPDAGSREYKRQLVRRWEGR